MKPNTTPGTQPQPKRFLTLTEAAAYIGVTKSYLYKLTSLRQIPHYKPRGKMCYFSVDELDAWLTTNRVATDEELTERAGQYCQRQKGGAA